MPTPGRAVESSHSEVETIVAETVRPVMQLYGIPGMAVGVVTRQRTDVLDFGVASRATGQPVSDDTLFEIGSLSKTFTATLAAEAQIEGRLSLSDSAAKDLPALRGSAFDRVSLINLGTHTSGGLPLQVPDEVTDDAELMRYFKAWKPSYAPGTYRTYANPSIGLLGMIAARSMGRDFVDLLENEIFPELGMKHSYLDVPASARGNYAQGYTKTGVPIRMAPGVLAAEAYGIRTTGRDMARFVAANMRMIDLDAKLQEAIIGTHTEYYRVGPMTQDLIWEQFPYPVALSDVLAGNSAKISFEANPAVGIDPPLPPQDDVLINKTGSTNGFGAYVAFVPRSRIGVVLLANKNYPIEARVKAAFEILSRLEAGAGRP